MAVSALRGGPQRGAGVVKAADLQRSCGGLEIEDGTALLLLAALTEGVLKQNEIDVGGTQRGNGRKLTLGVVGGGPCGLLLVLQRSDAHGVTQLEGKLFGAGASAVDLAKGELVSYHLLEHGD